MFRIDVWMFYAVFFVITGLVRDEFSWTTAAIAAGWFVGVNVLVYVVFSLLFRRVSP